MREISIASDRRREMRVLAQIKSKVPVILGGILCLRLGAQDNLVHQFYIDVGALHA